MTRRKAIITGATRGIGRGLFLRLMESGADVATIYHRDERAAEECRRLAQRANVKLIIERIDAADFESLESFVRHVHGTFGKIDYLINNVGINTFKSIAEVTLEEWERAQDVLLNSAFYLSKLLLPIMRRQRFGRIVNVGASSRDYFHGAPGLGPFGIHKAALAVLTKTLALEEMSHGITVNMVAPGSTEGAGDVPEGERIPISLIPMGRRVRVDEVVEGILFFLSESASAITGQVLGINGGLSV